MLPPPQRTPIVAFFSFIVAALSAQRTRTGTRVRGPSTASQGSSESPRAPRTARRCANCRHGGRGPALNEGSLRPYPSRNEHTPEPKITVQVRRLGDVVLRRATPTQGAALMFTCTTDGPSERASGFDSFWASGLLYGFFTSHPLRVDVSDEERTDSERAVDKITDVPTAHPVDFGNQALSAKRIRAVELPAKATIAQAADNAV